MLPINNCQTSLMGLRCVNLNVKNNTYRKSHPIPQVFCKNCRTINNKKQNTIIEAIPKHGLSYCSPSFYI